MDLPKIEPPLILSSAPTEILGYVATLVELCQSLGAHVAELEAELSMHKAERILLQQEIRSLRHLDPTD